MLDVEELVGAKEFAARKDVFSGKRVCFKPLSNCAILDSLKMSNGLKLFDGLEWGLSTY